MKLQLLAIPLLMALMLSPLAASAAVGTVTFTSPTSGQAISGVAAYAISGSISPAPTLPDNVAISVTNPIGQVVDFQSEAVAAGGAWTTYNTNAGGNPSWTTGTYTVAVSDSNGATGSTTFKYTAVNTSPTSALAVNARSDGIVYAGQTVQIFATAYWTGNGTAAKAATWTVAVWTPSGTASSVTWTSSTPAAGAALWTGALPAGTADGVYAVDISATESGVTSWTLTSFQVNSQIASAPGLTALQTALTGSLAGLGKNVTSLSAQLTAISTSISSVSSAVASVNSAVSSLSSQVGTINTNVGSLGTAVSGLTTQVGAISTAVGSIQTTVGTISSTLSTQGTSISSISSSIQTLTSDVTGLQTTVNGLGNLSSQMTSLQSSVSSLSSSVSSEQTYILVVALIAAVTLVLELAILIRKMS